VKIKNIKPYFCLVLYGCELELSQWGKNIDWEQCAEENIWT
jgi:hypothetical protein